MANRPAFYRLLAAVLALAGSSLPIEALQDGLLDESFWVDGRVLLDSPLSRVTATLVAPDGRLVVVGRRVDSGGEQTLFWAILNDASLGPPCVPNAPGGGSFLNAKAAAFDAEGRLLIAGNGSFPSVGEEGFAMRFLYPACDPDETFNLDGIFYSNLNEAAFNAVAVDSSSRVVLAGTAKDAGDDDKLVVVRLATTGLFDWGFANFGVFELDLFEPLLATAVVVQSNNRIVVGGSLSLGPLDGDVFVMRLDSLGDPDGTFAGDGFVQIDVRTDLLDLLWALALDPVTGNILAAGSSGIGIDSRVAVLRLEPDGAFDDTFDGNGIWTHSILDKDQATAIQLQSDGKILVAGDAWESGTLEQNFIVYRLLPDGEMDGSFGLVGSTSVNFGVSDPSQDGLLASTLHAGKLVVAGVSMDTAGSRAAVARLWSDLIFTDGFERGTAGGWSTASGAP